MSLCLSVTSRYSIKRDERINMLFSMDASFDQSYAVIYWNSGIYKNKGTSLWNFFLNSWLRQFRHGISIVEPAIEEMWTLRSWWTGQSLINWVDNTSEPRRSTAVVCRRDRHALSTARFCRAGQLATGDTCFRSQSQVFVCIRMHTCANKEDIFNRTAVTVTPSNRSRFSHLFHRLVGRPKICTCQNTENSKSD